MSRWRAFALILPAALVPWLTGWGGSDRKGAVCEDRPAPVVGERREPVLVQLSGYRDQPVNRQAPRIQPVQDSYYHDDYGEFEEDFTPEYYGEYEPNYTYDQVPIYSEPEEPAAVQDRPEVSFELFYTSLAPYGNWFQHPRYGWVWYPRDVRFGWRPYTDGRWVLTQEYGWMWVSDHSWGWAPFHYGRWTFDINYGWIWVPGTAWGPAWVAWRTGEDYVGWAPLPPEAVWYPDRGIVYQAGFAPERLSWRRWVFVQDRYFVAPDVQRYVVVPPRNVTLVNITRNTTNFAYVNNRIVNRSIDVQQLERVVDRPIRPLRVRNVTNINNITNVEQRVTNNTVSIYQPRVRRVEARPEPPPAIRRAARQVDLEERRERLQREAQQRVQQEREELQRQQQEERQRYRGNPQELQQRLQAEQRAYEQEQRLLQRQVQQRLQVERDPTAPARQPQRLRARDRTQRGQPATQPAPQREQQDRERQAQQPPATAPQAQPREEARETPRRAEPGRGRTEQPAPVARPAERPADRKGAPRVTPPPQAPTAEPLQPPGRDAQPQAAPDARPARPAPDAHERPQPRRPAHPPVAEPRSTPPAMVFSPVWGSSTSRPNSQLPYCTTNG